MNNLALYAAAVLIWGSTWIAITFQLGTVPPAVSVVYRFAAASLMLMVYCVVRRLPLAFSWRDHAGMALQGILLFGLNYVFVYQAEVSVNSGLVAVVFSLMVIFNLVGARLLFSTPLHPATVFGAVLGIGGLATIFLPALAGADSNSATVVGLVFALVSALSASLGNLTAAHNQERGLPVVQLNAFGMLYGTLFVGAYVLITGQPFLFDWSPAYVASLFYLALFGSVLAFGAYLTLIHRIGAGPAGYVTVAVPVVALVISTLFEGLQWNAYMLPGVFLCLIGNVLVLWRKAAA